MKAENRIYTSEEKKSFESYPILTAKQRADFFRSSENVRKILRKTNGSSRIYLWVRLIYFKLNSKFYFEISPRDFKLAAERLD